MFKEFVFAFFPCEIDLTDYTGCNPRNSVGFIPNHSLHLKPSQLYNGCVVVYENSFLYTGTPKLHQQLDIVNFFFILLKICVYSFYHFWKRNAVEHVTPFTRTI